MNLYGQLLFQAHSVLICPACNRTYKVDEIMLRGVFNEVIVLQTLCAQNHSPIVTVLLAPAPNGAQHVSITNDDVLVLHERLEQCNGKLASLWQTH